MRGQQRGAQLFHIFHNETLHPPAAAAVQRTFSAPPPPAFHYRAEKYARSAIFISPLAHLFLTARAFTFFLRLKHVGMEIKGIHATSYDGDLYRA